MAKRVGDSELADMRRRWRETDETVVSIAARFELTPSAIYRRANKLQWGPRALSGAAPSIAAGALEREVQHGTSGVAAPSPKATQGWQPRVPLTMEARIQRLLAIIDLQLEQLEKDMAAPDNLSVQDKDRLGRQAGAIVSNLEKVTELNTDHEKARASAPGTHAESDIETERMRREIAERLERLNAQWLAQEKSR